MFKRKPQTFEITEHPAVIAALEAMWRDAYETGLRDAKAIADDLYDEAQSTGASGEYLRGLADLIERLEI